MNPPAPQPSLRVLGGVGRTVDGGLIKPFSPMLAHVVAALVAAGPDGLTPEAIADELWGDKLPATWKSSLRNFMTRLRQDLPAGVLPPGDRRRLDLPPTDVDLWWLRDIAADDRLPEQGCELVLELLMSPPYQGFSAGPVIGRSLAELEGVRADLLRKLVVERPELFNAAVTARLGSFAAERPWDRALAVVVESVVGDQRRTPGAVGAALPLPPLADRALVSARLVTVRSALVGRQVIVDQIVEQLSQPETVGYELEAPIGAGTTSVLAAVATAMAERGHRTICIAGSDGPPAAFGPLLQELPELTPVIEEFLAGNEADNVKLSRCWTAMLARLEPDSVPLVVAVDNARWLDEHTEEFLRFLAQAASSRRLALLIGGRDLNSSDLGPWPGVSGVELRPLTDDDIGEHIAKVFPGRSPQLRRHLAEEVMDITGGLAAHVDEVIRAADPETLTLQGLIPTQSPMAGLDAVLGQFGGRVAAAAAVLGTEASANQLATIAGLGDRDFKAGLAEALDASVLRRSTTGRYQLVGSIRHSQLTALVDRFTLGDMHFRAVPLAGTNQQRAWHLESADWRATDVEKASAHLLAATDLVDAGAFRRAVSSFRTADRLQPDSLSVHDLIRYAEALDRSGADGHRVRRSAMTQAQMATDEALVLAAAASGLPEAEHLDGDARRVEMLKTVRYERLGPKDRLHHALALSRQLLLIGSTGEALEWANRAAVEGKTVDEQAAAWLAVRHVETWVASEDYDGGFDESDLIEDLDLQTRVKQAEVVSSLIAGGLDRSEDLLRELKRLSARLGDPLRTWHAGLLESLVLEELGMFDASDRVADATCDDGMLFGVAGALSARVAQSTRRGWHFGDAGSLARNTDPEQFDSVASLIARAGFAVELFHADQPSAALALAEDVLLRSTGSRFELAVAGLLATIGHHCSPTAQDKMRASLGQRVGTAMVVGAGLGSLGPVDGLLAHLSDSPTEREQLWRRSVELADRWRAPIWQVRTRAYLAAETKDRSLLEQAADIAARTQFVLPEAWWDFQVKALP